MIVRNTTLGTNAPSGVAVISPHTRSNHFVLVLFTSTTLMLQTSAGYERKTAFKDILPAVLLINLKIENNYKGDIQGRADGKH